MKELLPKILSFLLVLTSSGMINAERIDENQARQAAATFFNTSTDKSFRRVNAKELRLQTARKLKGCYVFDRKDGGTVFVSDDDALGYTVLGYTDAGSIDFDNLPPAMQDWLDQIGILMDAVHQGKINRRAILQTRAGDVIVDPLIKTKWNQGSPYNNLTPTQNGKHCITGCVATAIAQVLNYWRWPESAYAIGSYTFDYNPNNVISAVIDTHYDWDNMLNTYNSGQYNQAQADAVAKLMLDCGYCVNMIYGLSLSNAYVDSRRICQVFGYTCFGDMARRNYTDEAWHDFIKNDLINHRPVLYNGQGTNDGHEFILDGLRSDGLVHVNYGWGGYCDGWYVTTDMQGYNNDQYMIHGFEPVRQASTFSYTLENGVLTISGQGGMPEQYRLSTAPWSSKREEVKKVVISEGITSVCNYFSLDGEEDTSYYMNNIEEVSLPEGLLTLGEYAFGFTKLSQVELPRSLELLDYAFDDSDNLTKLRLGPNVMDYKSYNTTVIEVDEANPNLCVIDNCLYSKDRTWLKYSFSDSPTLIIPEQIEDINSSVFFNHDFFIYRPSNPPTVRGWFEGTDNIGTIIAPKHSSGYSSYTKNYFPNYKVYYCSDMDRVDTLTYWTLDNKVLTVSGLGALGDLRQMPYYSCSDSAEKIIVGEGITSVDWNAFAWFYNVNEIELPSTLSYLSSYSLPYYAKTITFTGTKAPLINTYTMLSDMYNGKLRVPIGSDGYDQLLSNLPYGWTIEYYTPQPMLTLKKPDDDTEHFIYSIEDWESLRSDYPNSVSLLTRDFPLLPYLTSNVIVEDDGAESGYLCPEFTLTDLSNGYMTTEKAPLTGFNPIVSFDVQKGNYTRKLQKGFNSSCLPFKLSETKLPENSSLYTFSHYDPDNEDAIFTSTEGVDPAEPCYILTNNAKTWTQSLDGFVISNTIPSENGQFCGTYISTDIFKDRGYAPRTYDNIFAPLADKLHPFRACFVMDSPANVRLQLLDGEETHISDIQSNKDGVMYRLDGVRVGKNTQHRGIYIKNGKLHVR